MNGQDWLNYWQAQAAGDGEKRKADWLDAVTGALGAGVGLMATGGNPAGAMAGWGIGKSVGSVGENAVNHTLTPGNVMGDAMGGIGAYSGYQNGMTPISPQGGGTQPDLPMPMPGGGPGEDLLARLLGQYPMMGFADGGEVQPQQPQGPVIRSSQDVADFMKGLEEAINGMPGSTYTPERVNHPTLEMLASVVPDVVKALPAPRQTNSVNKTIGAWLPAAATTFSAPINYGKAQREERNKKGSEAAKALADHRWSVARSLVDSLDTQRGAAMPSMAADDKPVDPAELKRLGAPAGIRNVGELRRWMESKRLTLSEQAGQRAEAKANAPAEDLSWLGSLVRESANGRKYLDMSTLTPKDQKAATQWAVSSGVFPATKQVVDKISRLEDARANINDMLAQGESFLPKGTNPMKRALAGGRNVVADVTQLNPTISSWKTWRISAIQQLVALAGGMGSGLRVNQAEIKQAVENDIPRITDNYETAKQKATNIAGLLDNAEEALLGGNPAPLTTEVGKDGLRHIVIRGQAQGGGVAAQQGGKIKVRRKSDGKEVMVDAAHAATFKSDPAYEVVQ